MVNGNKHCLLKTTINQTAVKGATMYLQPSCNWLIVTPARDFQDKWEAKVLWHRHFLQNLLLLVSHPTTSLASLLRSHITGLYHATSPPPQRAQLGRYSFKVGQPYTIYITSGETSRLESMQESTASDVKKWAEKILKMWRQIKSTRPTKKTRSCQSTTDHWVIMPPTKHGRTLVSSTQLPLSS